MGRPAWGSGTETINDLDGLVANFWRSIKYSPDETAEWAEWPVNENDLHARHVWLLDRLTDGLQARLEGDPEYHDPKIAGWWVWGMACWIGGQFCSGNGPWQSVDGRLVPLGNNGLGVNRRRVHLGDNRGVNRKLVHLGDSGQGVKRKLVHLGDNGRGVNRCDNRLRPWFSKLSERLARVRVASGDWSRVCGPSVTFVHGMTGVFLDPPYSADRDPALYRQESMTVASDVRSWAIEMGKRPDMRIALCGYDGEHDMPPEWEVYEWKANGGYAGLSPIEDSRGKLNACRERIWFSPACLPAARQLDLFSA